MFDDAALAKRGHFSVFPSIFVLFVEFPIKFHYFDVEIATLLMLLIIVFLCNKCKIILH